MNKKTVTTILGVVMIVLMSCAQNNDKNNVTNPNSKIKKTDKESVIPHRYGGWYCPDNVKGFPAVDIKNWGAVPVIKNRLPTKEEARSEASLIFIDIEKYPDAKPLKMNLPKLATFYNDHTKKDELIIIIQAVKVQDDSIVGFRYLNGGNGSAWLEDVVFVDEKEISKLNTTSFVSLNIDINATQEEIWKIMTSPMFLKDLQPIFDKEQKWSSTLEKSINVNFKYLNSSIKTAEFAKKLFGNMYIQNDFEINNSHYVEKFLLLTDEFTNHTELNIVCGPFGNDYEKQKVILENWAKKVKELSEK